MPEGTEERPITQSDLDEFSRRLDEWGKSLPENEQTLLRVVLAQAKGEESGDVEGFAMGTDFGLSASAILGPAVAGGLTAGAASGSPWHEWLRNWDRTDPG
jgi:hypothetical protein